MNKLSLILISIVFLLTACQTTNPDVITLDEVLSSFAEHQLVVKENKVSNHNIFGMKLNGVKPSSYELAGKLLTVYIFDSAEERKRGIEDFRDKTASMNIISYELYEVENVLIFYVYELDRNKKVETVDEMKEALREIGEK
ncbi:hypothetical protein KDN24_18980 [Bacillus sp. Bva_UNVM-123]|uniref:hypothetical protein n=1 Tax=Bacillus sp. Bva_UNVM-123 TaxID=2829798 RepID=UPI00391EF90C